MKWKYVFNSSLDSKYWGMKQDCRKYVQQTGYKFFTWNGQVCSVETGEYTGIDVDDLI